MALLFHGPASEGALSRVSRRSCIYQRCTRASSFAMVVPFMQRNDEPSFPAAAFSQIWLIFILVVQLYRAVSAVPYRREGSADRPECHAAGSMFGCG